MYMYVCMYVCTCMSVYVFMYVYVCMYVCMYVYVCLYSSLPAPACTGAASTPRSHARLSKTSARPVHSCGRGSASRKPRSEVVPEVACGNWPENSLEGPEYGMNWVTSKVPISSTLVTARTETTSGTGTKTRTRTQN